MSSESNNNKVVCRSFIQKVFNEGDLDRIGDYVSPYAINHELDALGDDLPPDGHSVQWLTDLVFLYRRAFPDLCLEIVDQVAEGSRVVTSLRMRGTQRNALMTLQASGKSIDVAGIRVDRVIDGKIAESWFHLDSLQMLRQLGALPALVRVPESLPAAPQTVPVPFLPNWVPAVADREVVAVS